MNQSTMILRRLYYLSFIADFINRAGNTITNLVNALKIMNYMCLLLSCSTVHYYKICKTIESLRRSIITNSVVKPLKLLCRLLVLALNYLILLPGYEFISEMFTISSHRVQDPINHHPHSMFGRWFIRTGWSIWSRTAFC